ncbi:hypothetical protein SAMN05421676_11579 [Salinibacillus kushneri]|uniref:Uncharacterized protein n=1 Tax=Salinibacillus kushneri TaxID=237682 RepID=A0A1I0J4W8_9BACI|nr:hypothetical protein [Salinibacillus kushneri]SEU04030.1 hypothetical protein SAMN05421676_11579 [Salinibacillus kushneri]
MNLSTNQGFTKKEFTSNRVIIKLLITGGALASVYSSNYITNTDKESELVEYTTNAESFKLSDRLISIGFFDETNIQSISHNYSYEQIMNVSSELINGRVLSNDPITDSALKNEHNEEIANIIYIKDKNEEDIPMHKLNSHRDYIEKAGVVTGLSLGVITSMPPLFSNIDWAVTVPASVLFFSLAIFMKFRRKIRSNPSGS